MKALAILFRLVFSILVLLATACYLQVSPTTTLSQFCSGDCASALAEQLCGFNWLTISLALVVVLTIISFTRLLDAVWNMLFSASIVLLLAAGLYSFCGPGIALPNALYHNEAVNQFCRSLPGYEIPIAIASLIFVGGWLSASACGRVAITTVVSFALWYGITEFFTYTTHLWANSASPALPEALNMVQSSPWILAAVPGAFFLIYALLMAFFETYIGGTIRKKAAKATEKADDKPAAPPATGSDDASSGQKTAEKPAEPARKTQPVLKPAEPASKTKPILKTAASTETTTRQLKLATPAAAKPAETTPEKAEKSPEEGSKEPEKKPAEQKTAEEKPAETTPPAPAEPSGEEITPEKIDSEPVTKSAEKTPDETQQADSDKKPATE